METRKKHDTKFSPLPTDYAKMVCDVFTTNFDAGLKALAKIDPGQWFFETAGRIYTDEVVICVSLMKKKELAATSVYASCDYDSRASSPTIQDLLSACVDGAGFVIGTLMASDNKKGLEQISQKSLAAMEKVPFDWAPTTVEERYKVFLKVDKTNPNLENLADEWLAKNDPDLKDLERQAEEELEKLFVTGPDGPGKRKSSKH
jgi:hypothetical protein